MEELVEELEEKLVEFSVILNEGADGSKIIDGGQIKFTIPIDMDWLENNFQSFFTAYLKPQERRL